MRFEAIAGFALGAAEIPEEALDFAATLLVDTLGVAAGAAALDSGRIARDHAVRFHAAARPADAATLLFDGRRASIPGAAFALGSQIDNLDAHDGLNPTKGHIGCAVVPALCAFAESRPELSARDALTALVISYEIAARAAVSLHATVTDYHTSGAWNGLGVAALGCRLRGAGPGVLRHALGIAEYHGPRSQMMREIANPTMLHDGSGMGALVGSMAVLLAEEGFEGGPAITVEGADIADHWADLGQDWTVLKNYIKPYPICRWAHAAIDGMRQVVAANGLTAADIARIEVGTFAESAALFAGMPETTSQAQYSLHFAMATQLVNGRIGPAEISGPGLRDPRVAAVIERIFVHEEPRHSARFPAGRWSDVTVHLTDGRRFGSGDVTPGGGPNPPMPKTEVEAKFRVMTAALGAERTDAIWSMRDRLTSSDLRFSRFLARLFAPPGQADG